MKNKKVLEFFKEKVNLLHDGVYKDYHNVAIQALEKQFAKKPRGKSITHEGFVANCPACNKFIKYIFRISWCQNCGQKLDWSVDDE